jgi:predicted lipoprotein with Yx(FWY)xxD motif
MLKRTLAAAVIVAATVATGSALAATHGSAASRSGTTVLLHKTKLGKVLSTSSGRTLYLYTPDAKNKSNCYTGCISFWPALIAKGKVQAGPGVKASLLGVTKRKNGQKQVTYKGHPLYTYVGDKKSGQVNGQGYQSIWWVMNAAGNAVKHAPAASVPTTTTTTTTTTPYPGY